MPPFITVVRQYAGAGSSLVLPHDVPVGRSLILVTHEYIVDPVTPTDPRGNTWRNDVGFGNTECWRAYVTTRLLAGDTITLGSAPAHVTVLEVDGLKNDVAHSSNHGNLGLAVGSDTASVPFPPMLVLYNSDHFGDTQDFTYAEPFTTLRTVDGAGVQRVGWLVTTTDTPVSLVKTWSPSAPGAYNDTLAVLYHDPDPVVIDEGDGGAGGAGGGGISTSTTGGECGDTGGFSTLAGGECASVGGTSTLAGGEPATTGGYSLPIAGCV